MNCYWIFLTHKCATRPNKEAGWLLAGFNTVHSIILTIHTNSSGWNDCFRWILTLIKQKRMAQLVWIKNFTTPLLAARWKSLPKVRTPSGLSFNRGIYTKRLSEPVTAFSPFILRRVYSIERTFGYAVQQRKMLLTKKQTFLAEKGKIHKFWTYG